MARGVSPLSRWMKLVANLAVIASLFARPISESKSVDDKYFKKLGDLKLEYRIYPPFPKSDRHFELAYKIANALHINSREWTVERLFPLDKNSPLDSGSINFAERVMRSYPFWSDAKISFSPDSDAATVEIHDLWTSKLVAEVHYVADELEWLLALEDENFLGLGSNISGGYAHYIENDWWQFGAKIYGFPSKYWDFSGNYNFQAGLWQAGASLKKHDAYIENGNLLFAGAYAESVFVPIYYSQDSADSIVRYRKNAYFEFIPQWKKMYIGGGIGYLDREISPFHDSNLDIISDKSRWIPIVARLGFTSIGYKNFVNLDNFVRIEDVPTGFLASASLGWNLDDISQKGGDKNLFIECEIADAKIHRFGYSAISTKFISKYGNRDIYLKFRHFAPITDTSFFRYGFSIDWFDRIRSTADRYFIADGRTGFRGYSAYYEIQHGSAQFLKFSGELRFFSSYEILTLRPGAGLFFDMGGISKNFLLDDSDRIMTDFGISFQICSTRSTAGNVNRFDISYNPQTKTFGFTIDSGRAFSFYLPMVISSFLKD